MAGFFSKCTSCVILEQKWSDSDNSDPDVRERKASDSSEVMEDGGKGQTWPHVSLLYLYQRLD